MQRTSARRSIRIRRSANRSAWPPSCMKASVPTCRRRRRSNAIRPVCMQAGSKSLRQRQKNGAPCEGRAVFLCGREKQRRALSLRRCTTPHTASPRVSRPKEDRPQKNPGLAPGKRYVIQRIGALGQSNRASGNGTTLLLAVTPAQRVSCAGAR
ncbi:hypothetical protein BN2475_460061 [Paraburkholderia ribeironis]|uniref:Uncharacterized protein n=1 Tax=Paraburkholderia ribeironis TaxID=1247936 RepID=A0A1N7S9L5_9BURK|nr:hypothetical protein BN2475_460061 [Paraburkholderia ribeironis]